MENLFYNISQVLGITIIHSLWQGLIIYIVLRLFMLGFPAATAVKKYRIAYASLVIMLGWFVYTLLEESARYNWLSTTALQIPPITLPAAVPVLSAPANKYYFTIAGYMPYLTMLYIAGVVFNALRLTLAWNSIYRIRQNISAAGFEGVIKDLSKKLALRKTIATSFSEWVDVPCITGFIKPIILLPLSITCHLSTEEIEAILLHELAHIKRNDYLLNFIQQVIGILLFFNPFARLVTRLINEERENCCDDMVVQATGSPFIYAQALLKLEENKQNEWQLALAATGKKYELLNRIERIMKTKNQTINIRPVLITLLALACSISSIAWLNPEIKDGKVKFKNAAPTIRLISAIVTSPAKPQATRMPEAPVVHKHKKSLVVKYYTDSTSVSRLNDTSIKNKKVKYKIVAEDENGNKKEYNSVNELPAADRGEFYRSTAGTDFGTADTAQLAAMKKFYSSDKWKKQQEVIQKQAAVLAKKFNSKAWKKQQRQIQKQVAAISKKYNSPEWKKQQEEFAMQGEKLSKKFNSPEWKKQQEEFAKMGKEIGEKFANDPEWKKQQAEFAKMGEEIGKKFANDPAWQKQQKIIAKMGEEIGKKFANDPAWRKQQEIIAKQAAEMAKQIEKSTERINKAESKEAAKDAKEKAEDHNNKDVPEQQ